ncbi:unnamed protein product [Caenorhabditis brenneri]
MKRVRQEFLPHVANHLFQDVELNDVKLEEVDEETFYKRQKVNLEGMIKKEDFIDKVPKEEPYYQEFQVKKPKPEKKHLEIPAWRPKIQCVTDFLNDDSDDVDFGMNLGSSVLFDDTIRTVSPVHHVDYHEESDDDYFEEQVITPAPTKVRALLLKSFNENPHPTALVMQQLAEECFARYKTVVDYFENRRLTKQIKCERNDPCERIKQFFMRENEETALTRISDDVRSALEEEIEAHLALKKKFSVGYLHVIMERTNLPPTFIRNQYDNVKRRKGNYGVWRNEVNDKSQLLGLDTLRQLEDAYLNKKYNCEDKEWTSTEIEALAVKLKIKHRDVQNWITRRNWATAGLARTELRRNDDPGCSRKLPTYKIEQLDAEFEFNRKPGLHERNRIASHLNLHELQVRNYFNKKRMATRKQEEWEVARNEFLRLPEFKKKMLESVAAERRKTAAESMDAANRIGVSYRTLCSFVEWRKATVGAANKNNQYQYY